MSEEKLLKYYGCNSLSEFIDTYLDCETAFDLLRSQFKEIDKLKNELEIEKDISEGMLETIDKAAEYIKRLPIDDEYMGYLNFTYGDRDNILEILKKEKNNEPSNINRETN